MSVSSNRESSILRDPREVVVVDVVIVVKRRAPSRVRPRSLLWAWNPGKKRGRHTSAPPGSSRRVNTGGGGGVDEERRGRFVRRGRPRLRLWLVAAAGVASASSGLAMSYGEKKFSRKIARRLGRVARRAHLRRTRRASVPDGVAAFSLSSLHRDPPEVRFRETLASSHAIAKGGGCFFQTSNTNSPRPFLARLVPGGLYPTRSAEGQRSYSTSSTSAGKGLRAVQPSAPAMWRRVKPEVLCPRLFCGNRSVTAKSRGKRAKVFLVEELEKSQLGWPSPMAKASVAPRAWNASGALFRSMPARRRGAARVRWDAWR